MIDPQSLMAEWRYLLADALMPSLVLVALVGAVCLSYWLVGRLARRR